MFLGVIGHMQEAKSQRYFRDLVKLSYMRLNELEIEFILCDLIICYSIHVNSNYIKFMLAS